MSVIKTYVVAIALWIGAMRGLLAFEIDFSTATYSGGVPSGWVQKVSSIYHPTLVSQQPGTPTGSDESGLYVTFYSATESNLVYCTSALTDDIVCDTVLAELRFFAQKESDIVDAFQVVVSTNDWKTFVSVGGQIKIQEYGRTEDEWVTYRRSVTIPGLKDSGNPVKVGIWLVPGGRSRAFGYIRSLKLSVAAAATPKNVCLKREGMAATDLAPGMEGVYPSVTVSPDPADSRLTIEGVYGIITRNGVTGAAEKFTAVNGTDEYIGGEISPALEAGETIAVNIFTKYTSTLPSAGDVVDGYAVEYAQETPSYTVSKSGSVWINEFTLDKVEICGTTNREYSAGWTLEMLSNENEGQGTASVAYTADLSEKFVFMRDDMVNGSTVGLIVREIFWRDLSENTVSSFPSGDYILRLKNSAGIVEHSVNVTVPVSGSYGMSGYAPWPATGDAYDWSGTASDGTFSWGAMNSATFGSVNDGQGFIVPVTSALTVSTIIGSGVGASPLSFASVVATVTNIENTAIYGQTKDYSAISSNGVAQITIEDGFSSDTNAIYATLHGSAFGWVSEVKGVKLSDGINVHESLSFFPTVAEDDFSSFAGYWRNMDKNRQWTLANETVSGKKNSFLQHNTFSLSTGTSRLMCDNYLYANGRKMCSVSFKIRNYTSTNRPDDMFSVLISTSADFPDGATVTSPAFSNKDPDYGYQQWRSYRVVFELPEDFCTAPQLWLQLKCESGGKTFSFTEIDDFRISFEDVVLPESLKQSVDGVAVSAPTNGQSTAFTFDVIPQTVDIVKNVSADLHLVVNGVTNIVPFAFSEGVFTNTISRVEGESITTNMAITAERLREEALHGLPFLTGDNVTYFAEVRYDSANGVIDPLKRNEVRYFPDNSVTSNINDKIYWMVESNYSPLARSFTVEGPALSIVGKPEITAEGITFTLHGYAESGITNLVINANGVEYTPFEGLATNSQVRVTGVFDALATGLAPNTEYTITVVAFDSNGNPLDPLTYPFTTLPVPPRGEITSDSSDSATLTVSGDAASYEVSAGWTASGDGKTWTRSGLSPNSEVSATIRAVNAGGKSAPVTVSGYTLAAAATKKPVIEVKVSSVTVTANNADAEALTEALNGNPDDTEYAVQVVNSQGVTNVNWQTLADWTTNIVELSAPVLDLTSTNYFHFVTRNKENVVTPVPEGSAAWTNCFFEMKAGFDGAIQVANPFGSVVFDLKLTDPVQSQNATAEIEYKIGDNDWVALDSIEVDFTALTITVEDLAWDAWAAVGNKQGTYGYKLRVRVVVGECTSEWSEIDGTLDFTPPSNPVIDGTPAGGVVTKNADIELAAEATDNVTSADKLVYRWTFNGAESVTNVLTRTAKEGENTASVVAIDSMGNVSAATTWTWTLDTKNPENLTINGTPSNGTVTKDPAVNFSATATDDTALTYHWTFNGVESTGDTLAGTAKEGKNTVSVYAEDEAGNVCDSVTRTWTLDTKKPENLAISGAPANGAITKDAAVNLAASATDATKLTYYWTFNDKESTGDTLSGTAKEGENTVSVYAEDEAGNVCDSVTWTWTLDTTSPAGLAISGAPAMGSVTKDVAVNLTASATDATSLVYYWEFNGVKRTGATLTGTAKEGANTASVYAVDAAGNVSVSVTRTWTLDTKEPEGLAISGDPANNAVTKEAAVNLAASATDATKLTYHWTFNDAVSTGDVLIGTAKEGVNTVSVYAEDEAGNVSASITRTWTLDTEAPESLAITGTPLNGAVTKDASVSLTAAATDNVTVADKLVYRWTLNGVESVGATLTGTAQEGENSATVVVEDEAGNVSAAVAWAWTLDTEAPEGIVINGTPGNGEVTREGAVNLTAVATDNVTSADKLVYRWTFNGVESVGAELTGTAQEGINNVGVVVEDEAGNVSAAATWTWTLDTEAPEDIAIDGTPTNGSVTKDAAVNLSASATDATELTYHWTLNGSKSSGNTLTGTAKEGVNTVSVYAEDAAGNVCTAATWSWTLDTKNPENIAISGTPANGEITKDAAVNLAATATDETELTYHWTFNGVESTGDVLTGTAKEGENTVSVYAEDEAGNVCDPVTLTWTLDTKKPEALAISGTPANSALTKEAAVNLTASATDNVTSSDKLVYRWIFNGVESSGAILTGTAKEGENIVSVVVEDEAGNVSAAVSWKWTLDTKKPEGLAIAGTPANGAVTKDVPVSLTASATDNVTSADKLVYRWTFNGVESVGAVLTGTAKEGDNTASVVAEDEAGNVSAAATWTWTLDTKAPVVTGLSGTPANGALTNVKEFSFTAKATDETTEDKDLTYIWTLNGQAVSATGDTFSGAVEVSGEYTVAVSAKDEAGNVSAPASLSWELDTSIPAAPVISGSPANGSKTREKAYNFTIIESEDDEGLTYHWKLLKGDAVIVGDHVDNTFAGELEDGKYVLVVYSVNKAGTKSAESSWSWTLDATAPADFTLTEEYAAITIEDNYVNAVPVNETGFSFVATADDTTALTYHWTLNGASVETTKARFDSEVETDGKYTVTVYAEDEVGNTSDTIEYVWTVDTILPSAQLSSDTPVHFNASAAPMTVSVTFNESVTNFTAESVNVVGSVKSVTTAGSGSEYTVTIVPGEDGAITVSIPENVVGDVAGNGNEASESLTRHYDDTRPFVTLSSDTPETIGAEDLFTVVVTFSESVTNFTEESIYVVNSRTIEIVEDTDAENAYIVNIVPDYDGTISFGIPENVVADAAGNRNKASATLTRICDITPPTVVLSTDTPEYFNAENAPMTVDVVFSEPVVGFTADSVEILANGTVTAVTGSGDTYVVAVTPIGDGEVSLRIKAGGAEDAVGNANIASSVLSRIYDNTPPEMPSELTGKSNQFKFEYSIDYDDIPVDENIAYYVWNFNGEIVYTYSSTLKGIPKHDQNQLSVYAVDKAGNTSSVIKEEWTYPRLQRNVEFGGGICVEISKGVTNSVAYLAASIQPGSDSSFTMNGFGSSTLNVTDLYMWFVVCDTIDGIPWHVRVDMVEFDKDTGELSVTLPKDSMMKDGVPYKSFFIRGISNCGPAE